MHLLRASAMHQKKKKKEVTDKAKKQIKNLSIAMVKLQGERFAKWPDKDETAGFISVITTILSTVVNFLSQTGALVPLEEIMEPVATIVNQSVVQAYQKVIYPEYKSEKYPYPDDDDLRKFIERIGYCTALVEKAIALCSTDNEEDIQRYENLIFLHNQVIDACSYDWQYVNIETQLEVNVYRNKGWYPEPRENRVYYKSQCLNATAVATRRKLISQYENKIKEIKDAKAAQEAAEKAERERVAREEAQKRFDAYWAEHAEEKASLETEQKELRSQISILNSSLHEQIAALNKEINSIPGKTEIDNIEERIKKLSEEKSTLGLFKGKEKKAIQEQIDQAYAEKKCVEDRMDVAKKEIESKIASVKADFQKKISPLQDRVYEISDELTKAR